MVNMEQNIVKHNHKCLWYTDWHQCNCGLFDTIAYNEPTDFGSIKKVVLSVEEAIRRQAAHGMSMGYKYISQDEALEDFMALNWAWIEKV